MHQQARQPPRASPPAPLPASSPASSPAPSMQTDANRTNNRRDHVGGPPRPPTGSDAPASGRPAGMESVERKLEGPSPESFKKLDQLVQNFFQKASTLILQSRIRVTPTLVRQPGGRGDGKKQNRWFGIDTDEIDEFREELRTWRTSGSFQNRPPPMVIEIYIDASRLVSNQSLVIVDDNGKRWDALEVLHSPASSGHDSPRGKPGSGRNTEIILERWRLELNSVPTGDLDDFGPYLPTIYKKAIVFFRSLFVATRIMPAWKYAQQSMSKGVHATPAVKARILDAEPEYGLYDRLRQPLMDGKEATTDYMFGDLDVPAGRMKISATYRNDCNFRVEDSEAMLSSRFMGVDEDSFKPSIRHRREHGRADSFAEVGSLPAHRHARGEPEAQQTYGSLSTFHGEGALGTSPLSALKAVRPVGSDSTSSTGSSRLASLDPETPNSLPIRASATRPSQRNLGGTSRRPSVSFQPFKAGSLSASPRMGDMEQPASPQSYSRPAGLGGLHRPGNRSSLTAGMAASLRGPGSPAIPLSETPPAASSPKPPSRYSSSFGHRRGKVSNDGQSHRDDDQVSSGRQSLSSSAQPGSGLLAEATGTSSGSFQLEDDNIGDFLQALENKKTLKSFEPNKKGESSAAKRTAAQLSKFQQMRYSNNLLTESMASSMQLQRSSSSSSRQLANVPCMANPASLSASSSPGKPLSPHTPHTPHTPAIPSRLSENSIIDYQAAEHAALRRPMRSRNTATEEDSTEDTPISQEGTPAIDIPLSPRVYQHSNNNRRASSVAQQHRILVGEDDTDAAQRSLSLGAYDREAPSLSAILTMQRAGEGDSGASSGLQAPPGIRASGQVSPTDDHDGNNSPVGFQAGQLYRIGHQLHGRGALSSAGRGSFSGDRYPDSTTHGTGEEGTDDEPLLFDMSELERPSRRSLEGGRGVGSVGSTGSDRFEPRGISRRGW